MNYFILSLLIPQTILFTSVFSSWLSRPKDQHRQRFTWLTVLFIFYTASEGFLPGSDFALSDQIQVILPYLSGIALASYYFYYIISEADLRVRTIFSPKNLFICLLAALATSFVGLSLIFSNPGVSKIVFVGIALVFTLFFLLHLLRRIGPHLYNQKAQHPSPYTSIPLYTLCGAIFMTSMPVVAFLGDFKVINLSLVNMSLVCAAISFYRCHIYEVRIENELLEQLGFFAERDAEYKASLAYHTILDKGLTPKELEVANAILSNQSYTEIADKLFITPKTVSKHASNIFKKLDCRNKIEFIEQYSEKSSSTATSNIESYLSVT
jgi:DNA-binding CsgD family transcriptional regulator